MEVEVSHVAPVAFGGAGADVFEVAGTESRGRREVIHETAADHDMGGVIGHTTDGRGVPEGAGLHGEDLKGKRVAIARPRAQAQRHRFVGRTGFGQFVIGESGEKVRQILGQPGNRGVGFKAPPVPPAAAAEGGQAEPLVRRWHVAQNHRCSMIAGEQASIRIDVGTAQSGPGRKDKDATRSNFLDDACLRQSGELPVIGRRDRDGATGRFRDGRSQCVEKMPAGERCWHVRHRPEHPVVQVGAGNGKADSGDIIPSESMRRQKSPAAFDPAPHNGIGTLRGGGVALMQPAGDDFAVTIDRAGLGRRRAAVDAQIERESGLHALTRR